MINRFNKEISYTYNQKQQRLNLFNCQYYSWIYMIRLKDWSMIKILILDSCQIDDNSVEAIANRNWSQLTSLDLVYNRITGQGIRKLVCSSYQLNFINLQELILDGNNIGNYGVKWLTKLNLPNLEKLHAVKCQIKQEGFKFLCKGQWPKLSFLYLGYYPFKNTENKMLLTGWQRIHQNYWKNIKQLCILQTEPINCLNIISVESSIFKISSYFLKIKNREIKKLLKQIFHTRELLTQQSQL